MVFSFGYLALMFVKFSLINFYVPQIKGCQIYFFPTKGCIKLNLKFIFHRQSNQGSIKGLTSCQRPLKHLDIVSEFFFKPIINN